MRDLAKTKMGESKLIFDIPHLVVQMGEKSNFDPVDLIKIFEFLEIVEPPVESVLPYSHHDNLGDSF
jgi:hypothetical protein